MFSEHGIVIRKQEKERENQWHIFQLMMLNISEIL